MANAYRLRVGQRVSYLAAAAGGAPVRWRSAKITSIANQNSVTLAIVGSNGTRLALNGGAAVARRTSSTQTNVWRPN